ncbi:PEBP-like protein [Schizophyllum commune H4-8]|uniref:PEBP-like protein n=1 Tax=Schizophyllum commune (strain H4-8 / FGSC 9210) TaxID=578458 RepID=D8QAX8_SCHCM|nr:PEBP-like protein [Schizophyllum commune H4-8]KAI5888955.1 PEBP-like protein [Schizophyllum commune H4-8]
MQPFTLLATIYAALFVTRPGPFDDVKDEFYRAKIVPDVLPSFEPLLELYVEFPGAVVRKPGVELGVKDTDTFPRFVINSVRHNDMFKKYVLFVVDPDAYYPDDPSVSQVRHYLGANYTVEGVGEDHIWSVAPQDNLRTPFTSPITNLTEPVTEWKSPAPPEDSDAHRYIVLAYRQPPLFTYDFIAPYLKSDRQGFNVSEFALNVGLDGPVGGTYFTVEA